MSTDPIADLLTRLRNANILFKPEVELPSSQMKESIVAILEREGFIKGYEVKIRRGKRILQIYLKYSEKRERVITHLERVSKLARREYVKKDEIPKVLNGLGICILSTSKGILTGQEADKSGVGGELLCYVW